ncbi:PTS sugar transporter subunit IIA [Holdemanella biformis]|jgi:PTS system fructose-specific IIA component|uniref:PTS sugar transporter subunit IIA n=1 Tax=Holdemanella biformis TaxID=1735 RepID=UPI001D136DC7|nr:PTS sugar transporter subunit IIA [Holdemanella biformis]MCC3353956.1 PTS sugar transporter subunit IIA [Holdemanella biformis]
MTGLIEDNYIFLNEDYKSKQELLSFIAAKAEELNICDTKEGLLEDLLAREAEFSTGLQDGFAIPHARSSHVKKVSVFFIRNKSVLDWETLDDSEVHYLFALLVPKENEGNIHLQMISKLATCLLEDDFKDKIKSTSDKSELKDYILKNITD